MKKLVFVAFVAVLLGLAACANGSNASDTFTPAPTATTGLQFAQGGVLNVPAGVLWGGVVPGTTPFANVTCSSVQALHFHRYKQVSVPLNATVGIFMTDTGLWGKIIFSQAPGQTTVTNKSETWPLCFDSPTPIIDPS